MNALALVPGPEMTLKLGYFEDSIRRRYCNTD